MGKCLGVFDSGFGGLTVLKELLQENQFERYVYFGDTLRVPYGTRSPETIRAFSMQDVRFLLSQGVDALVVACNTITAVAIGDIRARCPVPVYGVVEPAAVAAAKATKTGRIGLLATQATIDNGVYERVLRSHRTALELTEAACPRFVTLVEAAEPVDSPAVAAACEAYLAPIRAAGCDTVVMACTHFPVYESAIAAYLGAEVRIINSGAELAKSMTGERVNTPPEVAFYVSGDPAAFDGHRKSFLPELQTKPAERVDITRY